MNKSGFQKFVLKTVSFLRFLIFVIITLCISILSKAQDPIDRGPVADDVVVYFEKTECYGTCPAYSFRLFENGTAEYEGKAYVEKLGVFYAQVSDEKLEELKEIFHKYDFFDYEDKYTSFMSDLPTTYVYFSHEGRSKKITDYDEAPESLKMLEKEVDTFFKSLKWERGKE